MITRCRIIWIAIIVLIGLSASAHAETKKEECLKYFKETGDKITLEIRYKHAEWYVKLASWNLLPYATKEDLIKYISYCRSVVYDGSERVVFYDGMSGEELGKMGVTGPKIYK